MLTASGVYEILNTVNGKRYIGSAANFITRFAAHRHLLRQGKHHSRHLQRAWNKHGAAAFKFTPILLCSKDDCIFYEQLGIDSLQPEYNTSRIAGSTLGVKPDAETRVKMSASMRGNQRTLGFKHSPETKAKMAERMKGNTITAGRPCLTVMWSFSIGSPSMTPLSRSRLLAFGIKK